MCGHLHLHFTAFHRQHRTNIKQSQNVISLQYLHIFSLFRTHLVSFALIISFWRFCTLIVQNSKWQAFKIRFVSYTRQHTNYTKCEKRCWFARSDFEFRNFSFWISVFVLFFCLPHGCAKKFKKKLRIAF